MCLLSSVYLGNGFCDERIRGDVPLCPIRSGVLAFELAQVLPQKSVVYLDLSMFTFVCRYLHLFTLTSSYLQWPVQ